MSVPRIAAKIRRQLEGMFRELRLVQDVIMICCVAAAPTAVSLRTYLADPEYDEANVRMRVEYLGDHETSSTVVCCRLLDPKSAS